MDLETIRAANHVHKFQEGELSSPEMKEQLARLGELSDEDKKKLTADAFISALNIAKELTTRSEYDEESGTLDLTPHGLGKINLRVYHDDGETAEGDYEGTKPFNGISVDPSGVYSFHHTIGESPDDMVYVNRDGSIPEFYGDLDHLVHTTLEYLETLEVIHLQLAPQTIAAK